MFKRVFLVASVLVAVQAQSLSPEQKEQVEKACDDGKKAIEDQISAGSLDDATCEMVSAAVADDKATQDAYAEACPAIDVKATFSAAKTCDAFVAAYSTLCTQIVNCGDNPCFPSEAMITLANGASKKIAELKEGDSMVAVTAEGQVTTDTVTLLSLSKPMASANFVSLTANKTTLHLTSTHRVPFGEACCSMLKQAKDVKVGDKIWAVAKGAKAPTAVTVTAKSSAHKEGLHSPVLTNGGFPVVDGVVTSFDDLETVTLAKHTLKYLLPLCKAFSACNLFRRTFLNADRQYIDEAPVFATVQVARRALSGLVEAKKLA